MSVQYGSAITLTVEVSAPVGMELASGESIERCCQLAKQLHVDRIKFTHDGAIWTYCQPDGTAYILDSQSVVGYWSKDKGFTA